jgi:hypothetical protein
MEGGAKELYVPKHTLMNDLTCKVEVRIDAKERRSKGPRMPYLQETWENPFTIIYISIQA